MFVAIGAWWSGLGPTGQGWISGLGAAVAGGALDVAVQELTTPATVLDPKAIGAAALLAGLAYLKGHISGVIRTARADAANVKNTNTLS